MDFESRVATAGAYVLLDDGRIPFMVGPTRSRDRLGVVRLGGHKEVGETSLACAVREVLEEASIRIQPMLPPATYWVGNQQDEIELHEGSWPLGAGLMVPPLLVAGRLGNPGGALSVMYLARSHDKPVPSSETRGLLLLERADVERLSTQRLTLRQYLETGGCAVLREELPLDLPLEPFGQLRWLALLLKVRGDLLCVE